VDNIEKVVREIVYSRLEECLPQDLSKLRYSNLTALVQDVAQALLASPSIAIVERERLDEAKVWLKEFAAICDEEGMDATAIQVRKALTDLEKGG